MHVYFIRSGKKGDIKIGKSNDPEKRMAELQTGNPKILRLIATIPCKSEQEAFDLEKALHKTFKSRWLHGEWFHRNIRLKDIEKAKAKARERDRHLDNIDDHILSHMAAIKNE